MTKSSRCAMVSREEAIAGLVCVDHSALGQMDNVYLTNDGHQESPTMPDDANIALSFTVVMVDGTITGVA